MEKGKLHIREILIKSSYILRLIYLAVLTFAGLVFTYWRDLNEIIPMWSMTIAIDILGIAVCTILLQNAFLEKSTEKNQVEFTKLVTVIGTNLFVDMCCWIFDGMSEYAVVVKLANTAYYVLNCVITIYFWEYYRTEMELKETRNAIRDKIIKVVCIIGAIASIINWKFEFYFSVSSEGVYSRNGDAYVLSFIPITIAVLIVIYSIAKQVDDKVQRLALYSYIVYPMIGTLISNFYYGLSLVNVGAVLSLLSIYNNVHLRRKRIIAEQESTLAKQSITLMVSQMQPHFIYNVLTTISNLCRKDPEEAEEVTVMFSHYLRTNIDALKKTEPVPFDLELQHIKIYLELEKKRFGDKLNVMYDIQEHNFLVPSIGIQPIVENSVKHGIRGKEGPGHLTISTSLVDEGYQIVIADDGVGFDTEAPVKEDGRSHVGLANVKERLYKMVGANTEVISSVGKGCKTIITIPKTN